MEISNNEICTSISHQDGSELHYDKETNLVSFNKAVRYDVLIKMVKTLKREKFRQNLDTDLEF